MIAHRKRYERREGLGKQVQKAGCGLAATGCLICLLVPFILIASIMLAAMM